MSIFKKKTEDYEKAKEDVLIDKSPKLLLEKLKDFEKGVTQKSEKDREEKRDELVHANELMQSPILSELEEQYKKGLISGKSYEEVLSAFRTLKTPKVLSKPREMGEADNNSKEPVEKKEEVKEEKTEEKKEEGKSEEKKEESKEPPKKKKDELDESYTGLGPLNALRKYLFNAFKKNQKEKAYWSRAGNFYYLFEDVLSDINSILSENGLLSIDIDTLKKYLETLGFVDGTSIVEMPVKTPTMQAEESRMVLDFTPQAMEKINSTEELKEPDQEGKKPSAPAPPAAPQAGVAAPVAVVQAPVVQQGPSIDSEKLIEYEKAFEELRTKLEASEARFTDLTEKLTANSERLGELRGQISTRENIFAEMQLKLETLNAQIAEVNPQLVAKFQRDVSARLEDLDNSSKELEGSVAELFKQFEKVSEVFKDLRNIKLLIDVGRNVGEKLVKIEETESIINRMSSKVEDMYLQVEKKFSDLPIFVEKVNRIDGLSFELLQALDVMRSRMSDYVSKTELGEYKAKLENKFSRMEDEIDMVSDKPLTGSDREYFSKVLDVIGEKKDDLKHETKILNEQYDDALISQKAYNELVRIKEEKKRSLDELEGKIISALDRGRTDKRDMELLYKQSKTLTEGRFKQPITVASKPSMDKIKEEINREPQEAPVEEVKPAPTPVAEAVPAAKPVEEEKPLIIVEAKPMEAIPAQEEPVSKPDIEESQAEEEQAQTAKPIEQEEKGESEVKKPLKEEPVEKKEAKRVVKYITFEDERPEKLSENQIRHEVTSKGYGGAVNDILTNLQKLRQEYEPGNYSSIGFDEARGKNTKK